MKRSWLEDRIVVLYAEQLRRKPDEVRSELMLRGPEWQCDSLTNLEVLLELEAEFGFEAPHDIVTATALRSVKGLARHVMDCLASKTKARGA